MSGHRKRVHEYLDRIIDLPVQVKDCTVTRSNHVKIVLQCGEDTKFFIASGSSSDVRSWRNFRGQVIKWVKEKGEHNA